MATLNFRPPDFIKALRQVNVLYGRTLPVAIAAEAEAFFVMSFRNQGFTNKMLQPWKPTKSGKRSTFGHSAGILIKSGALKRSVRTVQKSRGIVHIAAGDQHVPYAKIHNEGFDGTQKVRSFRRKIHNGTATVRSHFRHMVMPKRQFMGDSEQLSSRIDKIIETEVAALERQLFHT